MAEIWSQKVRYLVLSATTIAIRSGAKHVFPAWASFGMIFCRLRSCTWILDCSRGLSRRVRKRSDGAMRVVLGALLHLRLPALQYRFSLFHVTF